MKEKKEVLRLGGKEITFEVGTLAIQTNGSVTVRCGGTIILATAVASKRQSELDYFPLTVEYVERLCAGGRIKGSRWVKREGKPSDESVLNSRVIDRCVRPLFPHEFKNEVQLIATVLSVDQENNPVDLALLGITAALHVSNIPWSGPLGIVRVGTNGDEFTVNPTEEERVGTTLDLIIAAGKDGVVMLESGSQQMTEEKYLEAVKFGSDRAHEVIDFMDKLREKYGQEKLPTVTEAPEPSLIKQIQSEAQKTIKTLVEEIMGTEYTEEKIAEAAMSKLEEIALGIKETLGDEAKMQLISDTVHDLFKKTLRKEMLSGSRPGKRQLDEIRPLAATVGLLPRTHGSALFQRGLTRVLSVATLGGPSLKQLIEGAEGEESKRYMHFYSMPPYASGETGRVGWPGRREIGHGALAERALIPVLPPEETFPYTIQVISEVMSSNGSTSMASTCGSTLALMDAGVPLASPVAGISVGLVKEGEKYVILTDIAGIEDFNGDMDFKVAGTKDGITAVQVDIKIAGLSLEIVKDALQKAKEAREKILAEMLKAIPESRSQLSPFAPRVVILQIPVDRIGEVIGPGGRMIRKIIEDTGCEVDIEDDGKVNIVGVDPAKVNQAVETIKSLTREVQVGEEYEGVVKRLQNFGAFIEVLPGKEGLVHVSKIGNGFVRHPEDHLKIGQKLKVKVAEIDELGRINLDMLEPISVPKTVRDTSREQHWRRPYGRDQRRPGFNQRRRPSPYRTK